MLSIRKNEFKFLERLSKSDLIRGKIEVEKIEFPHSTALKKDGINELLIRLQQDEIKHQNRIKGK